MKIYKWIIREGHPFLCVVLAENEEGARAAAIAYAKTRSCPRPCETDHLHRYFNESLLAVAELIVQEVAPGVVAWAQ